VHRARPEPARGNPASGRGASKRAAAKGEAVGADTRRAGRAPETASRRQIGALQRRDAITAAALDEFTERGFAARRMEDVARRAGVAKGTIYLHFRDKEALFQDLVRTEIVPVVSRFPEQLGDMPARAILERFATMFMQEIAGTRRGAILRLVIAEGQRFPSLAEFYYREVVERGIAFMRRVIAHGQARGEIAQSGLERYPQLIPAPAMVIIIWQALFDRFAPLDGPGMLAVHLDMIFGPRSTPS
jgi:AcrR family transcriptional regulator